MPYYEPDCLACTNNRKEKCTMAIPGYPYIENCVWYSEPLTLLSPAKVPPGGSIDPNRFIMEE